MHHVPRFSGLALITACLIAMVGCGETEVHRTDTNAVRDLSGNWNATDAQTTAKALIAKAMASPWADNFTASHNGAKPVVKVGRIYVEVPGEEIDTDIITDDLIQALQESGKVRIVASTSETDQARDERKQQDVNASDATRKEGFQEIGADYLLIGTIKTQNDQEGGQQQKFYSVTIKVTDVKTQEQKGFWTHKIAKDVSRSDYK